METIRLEVRVRGIVQGVGFRPFIFLLARQFGLVGRVSNDSEGVLIEAEGADAAVQRFIDAIRNQAPPLAVVEGIDTRTLCALGTEDAFVIAASEVGAERATLVSPDIATCDDCLNEVFDPRDRRAGYAFTNCTNCGPRFTIVCDVPYDRRNTTMADFALCAECAREYVDPLDRRFHAQPVACPVCGPRLSLLDGEGNVLEETPLSGAVHRLRDGRIVAIKGLGGYHLAVNARDEAATLRLRARKAREEKPFAIMVSDLEAARRIVQVDGAEEALLAGIRRPIVLLRRRDGNGVAASVAPGNAFLGVMLAYTPLHHLLLRAFDGPLVMTSANLSDEPIAYRDDDARQRLRDVADAFLTHDRPIHIRTDDSVARVFGQTVMLVRRSRGYVPQPVMLPMKLPRAILAVGAELKNTICVGRDHHAFLSHHIGDLENYEAFTSFQEAISHMQRLFDARPTLIAHDLHPDYLSTRWALEQNLPLCGVQHHHAHIASCLVDNGQLGPVIGVAFDGTGYGCNKTLWGGEFLIADLRSYERVGHLVDVPLPGGTAAIRAPWRMAAVHTWRAFGADMPELGVWRRNEAHWQTILQMARQGVNAPLSSSMGRLFDAVAALLDVRDTISYEGQAAIELEQIADPTEDGTYPFTLDTCDGRFEIDPAPMIHRIVDDLRQEVPRRIVAGRFHNTVADMIVRGCELTRRQAGLEGVALSGGVFQNLILLERATTRLRAAGFVVSHHAQVPCNDGGISLGQLAVAATLSSS